jgi:hypothetical protein
MQGRFPTLAWLIRVKPVDPQGGWLRLPAGPGGLYICPILPEAIKRIDRPPTIYICFLFRRGLLFFHQVYILVP